MPIPSSPRSRLVESLRPWLDQVVVVGGWAHRLYQLHAFAQQLRYEPLATLDPDIALPTRMLGERIGRDVASVASRMSPNRVVVIDPFAGSCNTLFWILRHLSNAEGIAFESDPQVFELTHRNLAILNQRVELIHGDYVRLLGERHGGATKATIPRSSGTLLTRTAPHAALLHA